MKLDLLYEVDVPKPWAQAGAGPAPAVLESIMRTIEVLGKEVIPELEAYKPDAARRACTPPR